MTAKSHPQIQTVSDEAGHQISVWVPIGLWREIASERETAFLLKSDAMKKRRGEAKARWRGISSHEARTQLGI